MLSEALKKIEALQEGWDGYRGVPISRAAIKTCEVLSVSPCSDGSLMIELYGGGAEVTISIDTDGNVSGVSWEQAGRAALEKG